jgi:hypothetical protein
VILETVIGTISEVRPANGGNVVIVSVESGARRDGPPISSGALVDIGTGGAVGTRVIAFRSSGGWIDAPSIAPDGTFECFSATTRQRRVDAASALQIAVDPNCNDRARRELGLTQSTCPLACAVPQGAVLPATAAAVVALILLQRRRATRRKQAG